MVKVKELNQIVVTEGSNKMYKPLDEVINDFLTKENINEDNLIDIKYGSVGYFQEGDGEGEIESTALIVYRTR